MSKRPAPKTTQERLGSLMRPETNLSRFPEIPVLQPITERAQPISVATRIEVVSRGIAEMLHDAYAMQHGHPIVNLDTCQPVVQRVYEGLARLSVVTLLDDEAVKRAEAAAVAHGMTILGDYMDEDYDDNIPSDVWAHRITTAIRAAIATLTAELMQVPR